MRHLCPLGHLPAAEGGKRSGRAEHPLPLRSCAGQKGDLDDHLPTLPRCQQVHQVHALRAGMRQGTVALRMGCERLRLAHHDRRFGQPFHQGVRLFSVRPVHHPLPDRRAARAGRHRQGVLRAGGTGQGDRCPDRARCTHCMGRGIRHGQRRCNGRAACDCPAPDGRGLRI